MTDDQRGGLSRAAIIAIVLLCLIVVLVIFWFLTIMFVIGVAS